MSCETNINIALAQIDTRTADIEANAEKILKFALCAHEENNADVAVFPQMSLPGFPLGDIVLRSSFRKNLKNALNSLADKLVQNGLGSMFVLVGTLSENSFNEKRESGDIAVLHEGKVSVLNAFSDGFGFFEIKNRIIATYVCNDFADNDSKAVLNAAKTLQQNKKADALIIADSSPFEEGKSELKNEVFAKIAQNIKAPVIYANQVGGQDEFVFDGASFVLSPEGRQLAVLKSFREDLIAWTLPQPDFDGEYPVGRIEPSMSGDEQVYRACVLGLKDYIEKNNFSGAVLGLSGGIDSALVAAMAADACGGENVMGISMPTKYSSDGSKDDAADLAGRIGAKYEVQPVENVFETFAEQLDAKGVAAENLQARCRGIIVMTYSNSHSLLALATGNKSEASCGYATMYGDTCGGYAPIKDVYKTRVWQLARWRNAYAEKRNEIPPIPENSIIKPPSAELRPDQKDSDSLPDYDKLDAILQGYIEKSYGLAELTAEGFDEETVLKVMRLVDMSEWKRRQCPTGPKVSSCTLGIDRCIPITKADNAH